MIKFPNHLLDIAHQISEQTQNDTFAAKIICTCGNSDLEILHSGGIQEIDGRKLPVTFENDGNFFMIIAVNCSKCGKSHLVFDADYHGWDGYVCFEDLENRKNQRPKLVHWKCEQCSSLSHKLQIEIQADRDTILDEGPIKASNGEFLITEHNWIEGFGWINMGITCTKCGYSTNDWISYETM